MEKISQYSFEEGKDLADENWSIQRLNDLTHKKKIGQKEMLIHCSVCIFKASSLLKLYIDS